MSHHYIIKYLFVFSFISTFSLNAQDITATTQTLKSRLQKDPVKTTGILSLQGTLTDISGITSRYNPATFRAIASLNFDILGVQAPFSFIYSNGNSVYRLPAFAFYGMSPSYKWAKLHLGDRSINFSPYTLNGHMFRGLGMELKPGRWRFSSMYGRLKRAVAEDRQFLQGLDPSYKRIAMGAKLGYESETSSIYGIIFKAKDYNDGLLFDSTSIIRPADNIVIGFNASHQLGPVLLQADLARNYLTRDTRSIQVVSDWTRNLWGLFDTKLASSYTHAFNLKSTIKIKQANWTMGYERVDPGYYSLGSLFFQNDFENVTTGLQWPMLNQKLTIAFQSGIQRTFLQSNESNRQNRWLMSANINYIPSTRVNTQFAISNFNHTTRMRSQTNPLSPIDSLQLVSSQRQISGSAIWAMNKEQTSNLGFSANYQVGSSIINDRIQQDKNDFWLLNMYYQSKTKSLWQWSTGFNYNASAVANIDLKSIGPFLQIQKSFWKNKLVTSINLSDSEIYQEKVHSHRAINAYASFNYTLGASTFYWRNSFVSRQSIFNNSLQGFREILTELAYTYALRPKSK